MTKLRVAIAGYGFIAAFHARAVLACAECELVAVAGRSRDKALAFAAEFGIPQTISLDELPSHAGVDLVINALPNSLHAPLSAACMEHGKHVLIEKPMAMNVAEGEHLLEVAKRCGTVLTVGHMWRFDPEVLALRAHIAAGNIGRIVKTKSYGIHVAWGPSGWFTNPVLAGGGALIDMGIHAIDTTRFLLGDPTPRNVHAYLSNAYAGGALDDSGVLLIEWETGTVSIVESGWWNPHMDGAEASTQVFGTSGYSQAFPTKILCGTGDNVVDSTPTFPARTDHCDQAMFSAQLAHVVAVCRGRELNRIGGENGVENLKICDAAYGRRQILAR